MCVLFIQSINFSCVEKWLAKKPVANESSSSSTSTSTSSSSSEISSPSSSSANVVNSPPTNDVHHELEGECEIVHEISGGSRRSTRTALSATAQSF